MPRRLKERVVNTFRGKKAQPEQQSQKQTEANNDNTLHPTKSTAPPPPTKTPKSKSTLFDTIRRKIRQPTSYNDENRPPAGKEGSSTTDTNKAGASNADISMADEFAAEADATQAREIPSKLEVIISSNSVKHTQEDPEEKINYTAVFEALKYFEEDTTSMASVHERFWKTPADYDGDYVHPNYWIAKIEQRKQTLRLELPHLAEHDRRALIFTQLNENVEYDEMQKKDTAPRKPFGRKDDLKLFVKRMTEYGEKKLLEAAALVSLPESGEEEEAELDDK